VDRKGNLIIRDHNLMVHHLCPECDAIAFPTIYLRIAEHLIRYMYKCIGCEHIWRHELKRTPEDST
jgi:hypothetical protein